MIFGVIAAFLLFIAFLLELGRQDPDAGLLAFILSGVAFSLGFAVGQLSP